MEIFGLFTGYCFGDYGHGPDGSEPCFSVQSESFSGYWVDNGDCTLWLPDASDGSKSCDARPSGLGQEIRYWSENSPANGLACQKTVCPWSESLSDWRRICLVIQTTSPADECTRSNRYDSNGSWIGNRAESRSSSRYNYTGGEKIWVRSILKFERHCTSS